MEERWVGPKGVLEREMPSLCTKLCCRGQRRMVGGRSVKQERYLANKRSCYKNRFLHKNTCWEGNSFPPPFLTPISYGQKWLILLKGSGGFITNGVNETCLNGWIGTVFCMWWVNIYVYIFFLSDNCWGYAIFQKQS